MKKISYNLTAQSISIIKYNSIVKTMDDWCWENTKRWERHPVWSHWNIRRLLLPDDVMSGSYSFKNEEDAIMFKLRFGL